MFEVCVVSKISRQDLEENQSSGQMEKGCGEDVDRGYTQI